MGRPFLCALVLKKFALSGCRQGTQNKFDKKYEKHNKKMEKDQ